MPYSYNGTNYYYDKASLEWYFKKENGILRILKMIAFYGHGIKFFKFYGRNWDSKLYEEAYINYRPRSHHKNTKFKSRLIDKAIIIQKKNASNIEIGSSRLAKILGVTTQTIGNLRTEGMPYSYNGTNYYHDKASLEWYFFRREEKHHDYILLLKKLTELIKIGTSNEFSLKEIYMNDFIGHKKKSLDALVIENIKKCYDPNLFKTPQDRHEND